MSDERDELALPRANPCGGKYWNGYALAWCNAEAREGFARCSRCEASERARKEALDAKRAAEAPPAKRRRTS